MSGAPGTRQNLPAEGKYFYLTSPFIEPAVNAQTRAMERSYERQGVERV
jgi:hypothetical protein